MITRDKLEGDAYIRLPKGLKILWQNFKKLKQKSSISKDEKEILIKLEILFKNPIETLVDFELAERSIMADSYFPPNDTITSNDDSTLLETDNDSTFKDFSNEYTA